MRARAVAFLGWGVLGPDFLKRGTTVTQLSDFIVFVT